MGLESACAENNIATVATQGPQSTQQLREPIAQNVWQPKDRNGHNSLENPSPKTCGNPRAAKHPVKDHWVLEKFHLLLRRQHADPPRVCHRLAGMQKNCLGPRLQKVVMLQRNKKNFWNPNPRPHNPATPQRPHSTWAAAQAICTGSRRFKPTPQRPKKFEYSPFLHTGMTSKKPILFHPTVTT